MKKYNGTAWVDTTLRQYKTATDTLITLPADIYADGNNATVGLKGNMSQTGTPTPQNPIQPSETGERTGNLLNPSDILPDTMFNVNANPPAFVYSDTFNCSNYIPVTSGTYLRMLNNAAIGNYFFEFDANKNYLRQKLPGEGAPMPISNDASYITFNISKTYDINKYMFARTSTPLPYEPYGYKLTISSANTTTPVYLGEVETTRWIRKLVLTGDEPWGKSGTYQGSFYAQIVTGILSETYTAYCSHLTFSTLSQYAKGKFCFNGGSTKNCNLWFNQFDSNTTVTDFKSYLAQQYAAGTPVIVWYVLANEETGILNEPLRKIGDYADTVSSITIPTITGKDTFDVETTLKPSEVSLSYTGWHDATVKEWDGSQWG